MPNVCSATHIPSSSAAIRQSEANFKIAIAISIIISIGFILIPTLSLHLLRSVKVGLITAASCLLTAALMATIYMKCFGLPCLLPCRKASIAHAHSGAGRASLQSPSQPLLAPGLLSSVPPTIVVDPPPPSVNSHRPHPTHVLSEAGKGGQLSSTRSSSSPQPNNPFVTPVKRPPTATPTMHHSPFLSPLSSAPRDVRWSSRSPSPFSPFSPLKSSVPSPAPTAEASSAIKHIGRTAGYIQELAATETNSRLIFGTVAPSVRRTLSNIQLPENLLLVAPAQEPEQEPAQFWGSLPPTVRFWVEPNADALGTYCPAPAEDASSPSFAIYGTTRVEYINHGTFDEYPTLSGTTYRVTSGSNAPREVTVICPSPTFIPTDQGQLIALLVQLAVSINEARGTLCRQEPRWVVHEREGIVALCYLLYQLRTQRVAVDFDRMVSRHGLPPVNAESRELIGSFARSIGFEYGMKFPRIK